jgi:hypothetical protein
LKPALAIIDYERRLDDVPSLLTNGPAAEHMDQLHEWIDYLLNQISDDPDDEELETVIRFAMREYEREADTETADYLRPEDLRALLVVAIDHALHVKARQRVDALGFVHEQFEEIELLARVAQPEAEINPLRQGFLLLTTAFDAAVFDLMRIAFKKKFFQLVGVFGGKEKLPLEEIGEAGGFEVLRDRIIEEQLKKRYVKDLLGILDTLRINCVDEAGGDKLADLIELVQRRNVHVHNRGVVDERYLETDPKSGKARFNTQNLKLGDVACIDIAYLDTAFRLCGNCVTALAAWADSN